MQNHYPYSNYWLRWLLTVAMAFWILPTAWAAGKGTIVGQVKDVEGAPVAGVNVYIKGTKSVLTNPGGMFTLTGVKQKARIVVNFSKEGYVPSQGTASLVNDATRVKDDDNDEDEGGSKLLKTTMVRTLLKSGAKQTLNTASSNALTENGSKVTLAANSLTVKGSVSIAISPINLAAKQIQAAPGDFSVRTSSGQLQKLGAFAIMDVTLTQNGSQVNVKAGSTANIELILPANTKLRNGMVKPMWFFNTVNGLWQEEGTGFVGASSTTSGRLAVFATVKHFTFWLWGQPIESTAVGGRVVDQNGAPVANATVAGGSHVLGGGDLVDFTKTDINGNYCIVMPLNSTIDLYATIWLSQGVFVSNTASSTTGGTPSACPTAQSVPDIMLSQQVSCISGDIKDSNNLPVAGATVFSTYGNVATTDANGTYQMLAPENTTAQVLVAGFPANTVTTSAGGGACSVANFRPSVTGTACLIGKMLPVLETWCPVSLIAPIFGNLVYAYNGLPGPTSTIISTSSPSDANGQYCIEGLQPNSVISMSSPNAGANSLASSLSSVNVGGVSGTCAKSTCNAGPDMRMVCNSI
jgi:hypothetical protein